MQTLLLSCEIFRYNYHWAANKPIVWRPSKWESSNWRPSSRWGKPPKIGSPTNLISKKVIYLLIPLPRTLFRIH